MCPNQAEFKYVHYPLDITAAGIAIAEGKCRDVCTMCI